MLATNAHLSLNADHTFELQYTHCDNSDMLYVVCGTCGCDKKDTAECAGYSLSQHSMTIITGKRLLLDATDLTTIAAVLYKYGAECFDIEYYAIVRISSSTLIAEHHVHDSEGRPLQHEIIRTGCGRIRSRYHV